MKNRFSKTISEISPFKIIVMGLLYIQFFGCSPESNTNNPNSAEDKFEASQETEKKEDNHPFLIVTKDMFSSLREKSDVEPWKSMKEDAIST